MARCLSRWDRRLKPKQRIILYALVLAAWGTLIILQTAGQLQTTAMSPEPMNEEPAVLMDSTVNQTKPKDHENNQH
ncbi:hypothetical protein GCM10028791_33440 [Echinicola sediminis]